MRRLNLKAAALVFVLGLVPLAFLEALFGFLRDFAGPSALLLLIPWIAICLFITRRI